jgi:hypothetical protein
MTMIRILAHTIATTIAIAALALAGPALAQPLPHPKTGQCSGGYVQSGSYCVPKTDRSRPAIPKVGQCPLRLAPVRLDLRKDALTPPQKRPARSFSRACPRPSKNARTGFLLATSWTRGVEPPLNRG